MNIEHNQWKKIFANKYILLSLYFLTLIAATLAINFVLNAVISIPALINTFKTFSVENQVNPLSIVSMKWIFIFQLKFWFIYILAFAIITVSVFLKLYKVHSAFKDINKGTKGTARWTTIEEIKETYKLVPDNDEEYEGESGVPIVHHEDNLYVDTNNTNTLVVASTQSGKTELYSYPYLDIVMRAKVKDSIIVTDIKGDMLKNTKEEFIKHDYLVYVLNLMNPYLSIGFNPLERVKQAYIKGDYAKAQMLCNTFSYSIFHNPNSKDPMWEESAMALVNALILAVCDINIKENTPEKITLYTVIMMLTDLGTKFDDDGYCKLDSFFDSLPSTSPAKLQYATIQFAQGKTRGGIFTLAMGKLKNYTSDAIAKMTAINTFDIEKLAYGEKPIALFIVYPDWDDSYYNIISTFLSQVSAVLSEKATLSKESTLPRRVRHLFEEVANIPPIEGLDRALAVGLSRGLVYTLVIQNVAQLEEKYGEKMTKSLMGNCGNQIYIMSDEMEDADAFSAKLGTKTVVTRDRQGEELSIEKTISEKEDNRDLMMPDELRKLKKGEWVVLRTKKREDLKKNRVEPNPIYASIKNGTQMLHRYEYLMHRFNHKMTFEELGIESDHRYIDLHKLIINFDDESKSEEESYNSQKEDCNSNENEKIEVEYKTLINELVSSDKYDYIKMIVKKYLSDEDYKDFTQITYIGELQEFFNNPDKIDIYKKIERHLN
ncbi:MAG: type IV secretory system conjugative DNA transfer family protein [Terrisporobacter sp.]|uniref:VirD4-like conjugal transfer protein, CD1115 family n=1 Tax=Terrisporobacter sp. TaxID=1965305 RepID=UPI002FC643D4